MDETRLKMDPAVAVFEAAQSEIRVAHLEAGVVNKMPTVLEGEAVEIAKSGLVGIEAISALSHRIHELGREHEAIDSAAKALMPA